MGTAGEEATVPVLTGLQGSLSAPGRILSSSPGAVPFLTGNRESVYTNTHRPGQVGRDGAAASTTVGAWKHTPENE